MRVEFFRHSVGDEERAAVDTALSGLFLTTGDKNEEFERLLAAYLGVSAAVTVSSCTAALHLALVSLCIGPGDEVITTPLSFVATANAVLMAGATPVFADVDAGSGLLDPAAVEAAVTDRTKAVLPVHLHGAMVDMPAFARLAAAKGLAVVEDAAHALESSVDGARPGTLSDAACFSFYATKSITCGEGGALATKRHDLADSVSQLRNHGMSKAATQRHADYEHWDVDRLGWKYNLTNFQAAMLIPQLARVDALHKRRADVWHSYAERFSSTGIPFPTAPGLPGAAHHLFTVRAPAGKRDFVLSELKAAGVGVGVHYRTIHLTGFYRSLGYREGMFPNAERIGGSTVSLPLYPDLSDDEVDHVVAAVVRAFRLAGRSP